MSNKYNSLKKSNLRDTFFKSGVRLKQFSNVGKIQARNVFRALVRLVIEYKDWIGNDVFELGDNVTDNVKIAKTKKASKQDLTMKDRGILLIPPSKRTSSEIEHILDLINKLGAFKDFSEDVREDLASECHYQYVPAGRTIIRQGAKAFAQYYIIMGQLQIIKTVTDNLTGEVTESIIGTLESGDMFGQIALLHNINRTATVVSKMPADLLLITRDVFDSHLRRILLEDWNVLRDALINFNYFKGWSDETMRECCILSKMSHYRKNEVLLGDGRGMVHYVYFILSGECQLIEHMIVEKIEIDKKTKYKLYDSHKSGKNLRKQIGRSKKIDFSNDEISNILSENLVLDETESNTGKTQGADTKDYIKLLSSKKSNTNVNMDRMSVITITLQDVINQWHEITDVVEMLIVEPCITQSGSQTKNISTVFMQICKFNRGACFGLGEQMKNRRIVSTTPVKCLMIPRYWLFQHNRANIWTRVKQFLNSKYPSNKKLLDTFVEKRAWVKYRREYANKIIQECKKLRCDTKMYHVPYSTRIHEDING